MFRWAWKSLTAQPAGLVGSAWSLSRVRGELEVFDIRPAR